MRLIIRCVGRQPLLVLGVGDRKLPDRFDSLLLIQAYGI
jgi:hypothetical protein